MEIAFLIRIKAGVRQPGLECEAFATSAADAICAERGGANSGTQCGVI